jgi:hypothetical protein
MSLDIPLSMQKVGSLAKALFDRECGRNFERGWDTDGGISAAFGHLEPITSVDRGGDVKGGLS